MSTTIAKKQRIAWVDIAKGFTILTVIWSHTLAYGSLARNIIFCFHMPLFFILSGFTLKPAKDFEDFIIRTKKDFKRLILPVLIIVAISSLLSIIVTGVNPASEFNKYLYRLFWANGVSIEDGMPSMGMPWFLVALFFAKFILRVLSLIFNDGFELIGFMIGFVGMALGVKHIWLPLNLDMALVCMMFVAGGMMAKNNFDWIQKHKTSIFIFSTFFVYYMLSCGRYIEFANHSYDIATIIEGFCTSFIVCLICKSVESIKIIDKIFCFIGTNTMPIFLTHHLDRFFQFLYITKNVYASCVLRTFWVLLIAFATMFLCRVLSKRVTKIKTWILSRI